MNTPAFLIRLQELTHTVPWGSFLWSLVLFSVGLCLCGVVLRLTLGRDSGFSQAISGALSIQFTYLTVIGLLTLLPGLRSQLSSLPFAELDRWHMTIPALSAASDGVLQEGTVRLAVLSLIVTVLDSLLPRPEKFVKWLLWRIGGALMAMAVYSFLCPLLSALWPACFGFWGMVTVLGLCGLVFAVWLVQLLKAVIMAENSRNGWLHRFFFSRPAGRLITWSILSGLIFILFMSLMNRDGISFFAFADFAIVPYLAAFASTAGLLRLFSGVF